MSWSMVVMEKKIRRPLFKYISDGQSLLGAYDKHHKTMAGSNEC